jgi:DNA invertase Pin-like site-specific DNA recombinase
VSVYGYLRVSTSEQADSGAGLAAQRQAIQHEAVRRGWTDVEYVEDGGYSGGSLDRPGISGLIPRLRRGDVLVVSKLDRLSRSLLDAVGLLEQAQRRGFVVVALDLGVDTGTPTGRLVASVMAAVAAWEREIIGQRTRDAMQAKKAQGTRFGRPSQIPADVQERIARLWDQGLSMAAIARTLNADGTPTAFGGKWWPSTVQGVLRCRENDRLAGLLPVPEEASA